MSKRKVATLPRRKFKVYLCGSMQGRPVESVLWERYLARQFCKRNGLDYYDPAASEGLEDLPKGAVIDMAATEKVMRGYVRKDDRNLAKCDGLILLTGDKATDGSWDEKSQMHFVYKRPVVVVAPKRCNGEHMSFASIRHKGNIFPTIWEATVQMAAIARKAGY